MMMILQKTSFLALSKASFSASAASVDKRASLIWHT